MSASPFEIATRRFASHGEAKKFFQAMLRGYRAGERVSDEDAQHLRALLLHHAEFAEKIGCGVDHFVVRASEHRTNCFHIVRTDQSEIHFSYIHCIDGAPSSEQSVLRAFRFTVQPDIDHARDLFFQNFADEAARVPCAITGELIARKQGHVDHCPPRSFDNIARGFLWCRKLAFDRVPLTDRTPAERKKPVQLADDILASLFRRYHATYATLDFIKAEINLSDNPERYQGAATPRIKIPCDVPVSDPAPELFFGV